MLKKFVFGSHDVRTIHSPNHSWLTPAGYEPLDSRYTRTSDDGRNDFKIDSTSSETRGEKFTPLVSLMSGNEEWANIIRTVLEINGGCLPAICVVCFIFDLFL